MHKPEQNQVENYCIKFFILLPSIKIAEKRIMEAGGRRKHYCYHKLICIASTPIWM